MPFQTNNPRSSDVWTDDRIILLLKLDAENVLSRSGIADALAEQTGSKFSRNAVIGKLARLGAPPKRKLDKPIVFNPPKPKIQPFHILKPKEPPIAPQSPLGLDLCDLTDRTCRYPVHNENEPVAFCGHPVSHRSYCAAHFAICYYEPRKERPDQAHRIRVQNARRWRAELH